MKLRKRLTNNEMLLCSIRGGQVFAMLVQRGRLVEAADQRRAAALRAQIREAHYRAADIERDIAALREKLNKTEEALHLHARASGGFHADKAKHVQSVSKFRSIEKIKFAQGVANNVSGLVNGEKFSVAQSSLERIGVSLQAEIERLKGDISRKQTEITRLENRIKALSSQLSSLNRSVT